jgi:exopolysaccharide production protein ExoZ
LYWLLTLAMVAADLVMPALFKTLKVTPVALVKSLLFVPHYSASFPDSVWPLLVPGWTLNYEMFFYLVLAASLCLPAATRLFALVGVLGALTAAGFLLGPFASAAARTYTDPLLLEFAGGALIGVAWLRDNGRLPIGLSLLLIGLGAVLLVRRDQAPLGEFNTMAGALLVLIGALDRRWATWRNKPLQALGDSSYSLYLTHLFTLAILRVAWARLVHGVATPALGAACMLVALGTCAGVGWLSYRWMELPLLRWMSRPRRAALAPMRT